MNYKEILTDHRHISTHIRTTFDNAMIQVGNMEVSANLAVMREISELCRAATNSDEQANIRRAIAPLLHVKI